MTRQSNVILAGLATDPQWWDGALDRIACGDSPKAVSEEYAILFGVFMRWIEDDAGRKSEYDAALRIASEGHAHECLAIADEQAEVLKRDGTTFDPDVARDKLRIETRLKLAGKWDRARYGETVKHEHTAALVLVDAGLVGFASDLLKRIAAPRRELDVTPQLDESMRAAPEADAQSVAGTDASAEFPDLLPRTLPASQEPTTALPAPIAAPQEQIQVSAHPPAEHPSPVPAGAASRLDSGRAVSPL